MTCVVTLLDFLPQVTLPVASAGPENDSALKLKPISKAPGDLIPVAEYDTLSIIVEPEVKTTEILHVPLKFNVVHATLYC